jgi:hypothetical protein
MWMLRLSAYLFKEPGSWADKRKPFASISMGLTSAIISATNATGQTQRGHVLTGWERHLKVLKGASLFQRIKFIHDWQPTNSQKLKFAKSTDASIGICPCCKTTLEDHNHVLRRPSQGRTRYLALKDILGTISETKLPAGPILWQGLTHWLYHTSEPQSIDTSRYSGRKLFAWGLLEAPHEVSKKTPTQRVGDFDAHQSWNVQ